MGKVSGNDNALFLLPYGNICSLIRLFYKISYIFMICKIVRKIVVTRIRPLKRGQKKKIGDIFVSYLKKKIPEFS